MSDTQDDTDSQPTPGAWDQMGFDLFDSEGKLLAQVVQRDGPSGLEAARVMAAAGTAAHEAAQMGYDPVEAVEDTPKHISALERCRRYFREQYRAGEIGSLRSSILSDVEDALASAEGSGDE